MEGRRISIAGKRWRLVYARLPAGEHANCQGPHIPGKTIRISPKLKRSIRLLSESLIHEILHASVWSLDEEAVDGFAADVTRILDQEGCLATGKDA